MLQFTVFQTRCESESVSEVTGVIKMGSNGKTDQVNVMKREP